MRAWRTWIPPNVLARTRARLETIPPSELLAAAEHAPGFPDGEPEFVEIRDVRTRLDDGTVQLRPLAVIQVTPGRGRVKLVGYCPLAGGVLVTLVGRQQHNPSPSA